MEDLFAKVGELDGIDVTSPYSPEGAGQVSKTTPIAFAELQVRDREYQKLLDLGKEVQDLGKDVQVDGLTVEYGGDMFSKFEMPESEALGLLAAIIILLIAFGSVLAMGLPIITALFGLGTGVALTVLVSNVQSMPDFAPQLTAMIGLGVGIDYALFIVTRYREGLHAGLEPDDAVAAAIDTSGRAVLFAGITVDHLVDGPVPHGPRVRARARDRRRARRARHDGGRDHAAPGTDRLRGAAHRGHAVARRDRHARRHGRIAARGAVRRGRVRAHRHRRPHRRARRQQDVRQGTAQGGPAPQGASRAKSSLGTGGAG